MLTEIARHTTDLSIEGLESTFTKLPSRLRNAELALNALEASGFVPENIELYMRANAWTQAAEATTQRVLMTTFQAYDVNDGLVGYGFPTVSIYKRGLIDIDRLRESYGYQIDFEEKRRQVELLDAQLLNNRISSQQMNNEIKIVISPPPIDTSVSHIAKELGYFPDKKIAMIRVLQYEEKSKIMKTSQIAVENTDLEVFTNLISLCLGKQEETVLSSTEILGKQIMLPKGKVRTPIDVARIYDRMLDAKTGKRHYLGEEIGNKKRDYTSISTHSQKIEELTSPIVDRLVGNDIEIAKSLYANKATESVRNSILQALKATDRNDRPLLDYDKRTILLDALNKSFTIAAAEIVEDFVIKNLYISMLCVVNPEKAEEYFYKSDIDSTRNSYLKHPEIALISSPPIAPIKNLQLFFCGEMFEISSGSTLFNMTPGQFNSLLREGGKWKYHTGDCVNTIPKKCGRRNVDVGPCNICKVCEKLPQLSVGFSLN